MNVASALPYTEATLRRDLSDVFRICHRLRWSVSVGNHFSAAVSASGRQFLLNRKWQHFDTIRPEDLALIDSHETGTPDDIDDFA